jgi:hypothetical protein
LQTGVLKASITEKIKEFLQNLKKPLAFLHEVWYNVARERTDVSRVGFPYDYFDFFRFWRFTHEIRSDESRAARG